MDGEGDNNQPPAEGGEPPVNNQDGGAQEDAGQPQPLPDQQMEGDGGMDPGMG